MGANFMYKLTGVLTKVGRDENQLYILIEGDQNQIQDWNSKKYNVFVKVNTNQQANINQQTSPIDTLILSIESTLVVDKKFETLLVSALQNGQKVSIYIKASELDKLNENTKEGKDEVSNTDGSNGNKQEEKSEQLQNSKEVSDNDYTIVSKVEILK